MTQATAKKATFTRSNGNTYQVFCNMKQFGQGRTLYITATRVGGTSEYRSSYSLRDEQFVNYKAGELDMAKDAARALGII